MSIHLGMVRSPSRLMGFSHRAPFRLFHPHQTEEMFGISNRLPDYMAATLGYGQIDAKGKLPSE